jgi:hypothetical protein
MEWARMLAYVTGTVDQELLLRNEYPRGRAGAARRGRGAATLESRVVVSPTRPGMTQTGCAAARHSISSSARTRRATTGGRWEGNGNRRFRLV